MIGLTVTSDLADAAAQLRRVADGLPDRLEQAVATLSRELQQALKEHAPVGKPNPGYNGQARPVGVLRDSIRFTADGLAAEFVAADTAQYVIGGTDPHLIKPRGKQALAFNWDKAGGFVAFRSVHHPGTRPNDFRMAAVADTADAAGDELEAVADWVTELFG